MVVVDTQESDDQGLGRLTHSIRRSRPYTMELGAENNDGLSQQAVTPLTMSAYERTPH